MLIEAHCNNDPDTVCEGSCHLELGGNPRAVRLTAMNAFAHEANRQAKPLNRSLHAAKSAKKDELKVAREGSVKYLNTAISRNGIDQKGS
jgi:hypothetical protein